MPRKGERQNLANKQQGKKQNGCGSCLFYLAQGTRSESGEAAESINLGLPQEGFPPAVWERRVLAKRGEGGEEGESWLEVKEEEMMPLRW
jgi:hypothetical protein